MAELKPCPFCGGKASYTDNYNGNGVGHCVYCEDCGAGTAILTGETPPEKLKAMVIRDWNRRADTGQLAHWIPGKRGKWRCSCCGNEIYCTSPDDLQRNHEFCGHCGAEMKDQCDMRTLIEEAIL